MEEMVLIYSGLVKFELFIIQFLYTSENSVVSRSKVIAPRAASNVACVCTIDKVGDSRGGRGGGKGRGGLEKGCFIFIQSCTYQLISRCLMI